MADDGVCGWDSKLQDETVTQSEEMIGCSGVGVWNYSEQKIKKVADCSWGWQIKVFWKVLVTGFPLASFFYDTLLRPKSIIYIFDFF